MKCHVILALAVLLLGATTTTHKAVAGGYWRFYISVDGKPAFTGGIGVFGEYSPLDHLESSVEGGVQLGVDSYLDENTSGDVTLTGDVVFRDQEHPPLHMKQLRLVYERHESDRASGTVVAGGYYDWRLHPEDAAFIVAHYRRLANAAPARRMEADPERDGDVAFAWGKGTAYAVLAIAVGVLAWLIVRKRGQRQVADRSCVGPNVA